MSGTGTQIGSDARSSPGSGKRVELPRRLLPWAALGRSCEQGVQSLNRSQGIYDFVMCGRGTAHRWKKGWTHDWKEGVSSGSMPPKYMSGTCGARNQAVSFQLHHPQQTCCRFIFWPQHRGAWDSPAPDLGASVSHGGLLEVMVGCCRNKTRACASPSLSMWNILAWVEWSPHTRADLRGPQFGRVRDQVPGCAFAESCCPSAGFWHAHTSAASSWILPSHSPAVSLSDYMARRGFVFHSLLF